MQRLFGSPHVCDFATIQHIRCEDTLQSWNPAYIRTTSSGDVGSRTVMQAKADIQAF